VREMYRVNVEREPGFWIIRVQDLPEVVTQARRLAAVEQNAREAIAVRLERPLDEVEVSLNIVVPTVVKSALDEAQRLQQEASDCLERAGTASSEAARWLTKELGLTLREAAELLGSRSSASPNLSRRACIRKLSTVRDGVRGSALRSRVGVQPVIVQGESISANDGSLARCQPGRSDGERSSQRQPRRVPIRSHIPTSPPPP